MDNALMIRADARAAGMVTATRVGGARHSDRYRTRTVALSDCISIMPDGSRSVFKPARKSYGSSIRQVYQAPAARLTSADLPALFCD